MRRIVSEDTKEIAKLDYEASIQEAADRMRFQQEIGLATCKSTILVNGGAIIGLLTFIGNHPTVQDQAGLKNSIISFSLGIGCTLFSLVIGYIGQEWLSNLRTTLAWNAQQKMQAEPPSHSTAKEAKMGHRLMIVSWSLVMTGVGSFVVGAIMAANAIL